MSEVSVQCSAAGVSRTERLMRGFCQLAARRDMQKFRKLPDRLLRDAGYEPHLLPPSFEDASSQHAATRLELSVLGHRSRR